MLRVRNTPGRRSTAAATGMRSVRVDGVYQADVYVGFKPIDEWTSVATKDEMIELMSEKLETVPGVVFNFTQPMAMRLNETVAGVRADLALKIFGDDEVELERLADIALAEISHRCLHSVQ